MMKNMVIFAGQKVALREKRISDATWDYAWRRDPELTRLEALPPLRLSFQEYLQNYEEEMCNSSRRLRCFAIDTLDGKHIGNCMYYGIEEEKRQAELGIMIGDREIWDKGYGTDAVNTLLGYIFANTDLERIYLNTLELNDRARRCFQKCGFVTYGQVKRHGNKFIIMELYRSSFKPALVADVLS